MLFASACAEAQTLQQTLFFDFGSDVLGRGELTSAEADANGNYWNNIRSLYRPDREILLTGSLYSCPFVWMFFPVFWCFSYTFVCELYRKSITLHSKT